MIKETDSNSPKSPIAPGIKDKMDMFSTTTNSEVKRKAVTSPEVEMSKKEKKKLREIEKISEKTGDQGQQAGQT